MFESGHSRRSRAGPHIHPCPLRSESNRISTCHEMTLSARKINDFLEPNEVNRILDYALARTAEFAPSEVESETGVRLDPTYRQSRTIFDLDEIWGIFEHRLRTLIPYVRKELAIAWFPLDEIERQLTAHQEGGFFAVHTDNGGSESDTRRVTAVFHFYREPKRFSGSELCLYDAIEQNGIRVPGVRSECLAPINNSVVFFARDVYHAVSPVYLPTADFVDSRFAVTMWARTGEWPERLRPTPPAS